MAYIFKPKGICARQISFDVENGKLKNVAYVGGCEGNHSGIESLVDGMDVDEVIKRLKGIKCGPRATSCPDQLAAALEKYKAEN